MTTAEATTTADLDTIRALWREYAAWLGADLAPGMEAELAGLPGRYAPPGGTLLLAKGRDGQALGCVALRPLAIPGTCELKRLYVRDTARGTGTGQALVSAALAFADRAGHRQVLLDTLPRMDAAQRLYRALGFTPIPSYNGDPTPGLLFMGKTLYPAGPSQGNRI